ncbi:unnamed protein product [Durusdinium trenchii]|uniref:Ankyrin repeat protein n=1 Tax=Durusdinium trenchii TaxID=1381693 RepID=A0ABP0HL56_9DINO
MMQISAVSGRTVAQVDEDELLDMVETGKSFLHLKQLLSTKVGHSRFRQRLLSDTIGELHDSMPLIPVSSVQLVILDFCAPDETKWDELDRGCRENNVRAVESLLQKPYDPNWRGGAFNATPIHIAANRGHLEVVRLLLEAGADKDAVRTDGATALFIAAKNGHLEVVRLMLEAGADKDAVQTEGPTALFIAAQKGHFQAVQLLLEAGADKDAVHGKRATALYIAAQEGYLEVVRLLLEAGVDKNAAITDNGSTPLLIAIQNGHSEIVRLLLWG